MTLIIMEKSVNIIQAGKYWLPTKIKTPVPLLTTHS
jgi:hypothetical protein